MITRYLRQKAYDWDAEDNSRITQIAMDMHNQATGNLIGLVSGESQIALARSVVGKNPEFYRKVAEIKRAEERSLVDNLKLVGSYLLGKII